MDYVDIMKLSEDHLFDVAGDIIVYIYGDSVLLLLEILHCLCTVLAMVVLG